MHHEANEEVTIFSLCVELILKLLSEKKPPKNIHTKMKDYNAMPLKLFRIRFFFLPLLCVLCCHLTPKTTSHHSLTVTFYLAVMS